MNHLKKKIRQKARVEGSICKSYLEEEASFFFSHYFSEDVNLSFVTAPRNEEAVEQEFSQTMLSIFRQHGRPAGKCVEIWLSDKDYNVEHTYVLLNCAEVAPFVRLYKIHVQFNYIYIYIYLSILIEKEHNTYLQYIRITTSIW